MCPVWADRTKSTCQLFVLELLLRVQQVVVREVWHRETKCPTIVEADSPFLNRLRREDDHPCSSLRPIERRGRSILKHRDRLDGIHIHIVDVVHIDDGSVDDEER